MPDAHTDPFEQHRDRLQTLAYRMLSQVRAAEDIVQDAYLRWRSVVPLDVTMPRLVRPSPAFSLHLPCSFPLFVRAQMLV